MKAPSKSILSLEYTENRPDSEEPGVYVFGASHGGFYVISADDAGMPLLGYSDKGNFSADNIPPAMKWWLSTYACELNASEPGAFFMTDTQRTLRPEIGPLLKTTWNQDDPFNRRCPLFGSQRAVTGCVATALAQVMNYHQYPAKGTGSNSYTLSYNNSTVSLDFSTCTFDWADMADSYSGQYSQAQADAVAELMFACGVAVDMQYTPSESGAASFNAAKALNEYFGYDQAVVCLERQYYTSSEWEDLVYSQLKDYGPVQYSGSNSSSGHSFVCDGYRSDGYFHINWGWGGVSDGYFLLSALDPSQQGIGGSTAGYNSGQDIIANVLRPREGSTPTVLIAYPQGFRFSNSSVALGAVASVSGPLYNMGSQTIGGYMGVCMKNDVTGETFYAEYPYYSDIEPLSGFSALNFYMPSDLPEGSYTVSPGFRTDNDNVWTPSKVNIAYPQTVHMTVTGKTATFSTPTGAELTSTDLSLDTPLHLDAIFKLTATIRNTGDSEFYGDIRPALISGTSIVALGESAAADIASGSSMNFEYAGSFNLFADGKKPEPGEYTMALAQQSGNGYKIISNIINVTLQAASNASIQVTDFKVIGTPATIDPEAVNIQTTVKCTSGYFSGPLTAVIFDGESGYSVCTQDRIALINEGESQTIDYTMAIPSPVADKRYLAGLYRGQTFISGKYIDFSFTTTGIDNIGITDRRPWPNPTDGIVHLGEAAQCDGTILSLAGAAIAPIRKGDTSVDMSGLPSGLYILKIGHHTYRIFRR